MLTTLGLSLLLAAPAPAADRPTVSGGYKKQVDMSAGAPTDDSAWPKVEAALAALPAPAAAGDMLDGIESPLVDYPGPPEPESHSNPIAVVLQATGNDDAARKLENLPANAAADLGHGEHVSNSAPDDPYRELRIGERQRASLYSLVRRTIKNNRGDDARVMLSLREQLIRFGRTALGQAQFDCFRIRERVENRLEAAHFAVGLRNYAAERRPVPEKGQTIYKAADDRSREQRYPADYRAYFSKVRDAARAVAPGR